MPAGNSGQVFQVGEWIVHPALDSIARGDETHKLEPRTMRLLLCLIDSAGGVVSVDRLLTEVWTGVVVGPASVYQAVSQLRKVLGDVDTEPTYIANVPRKGYRLLAPVRAVDPPVAAATPQQGPPTNRLQAPKAAQSASPAAAPEPADPVATPEQADSAGARAPTASPVRAAPIASRASPARRLRLGAISGLALLLLMSAAWFWLKESPVAEASAASIVVLPFIDMTAEKSNQPFCDGLTEELSNWLAQIPMLRVVARTSAFAFRGQGEDVRKIGKTLGTNHILEGSMRRSGDHMRVTVQLIDARNGYHLWSANYDKPLDDTIKVQEDISRSVAQSLQIRLTPDTTLRFAARRSENPQAYQLYLRARYYQQQRTERSNNQAIELYQQVLDADPKFALAYVGLSFARINQIYFEDRPVDQVVAEVEPYISTALRLDERLSDAYTVRAALRNEQQKIPAALEDLHHAIDLNPNDSMAYAVLGRIMLRDGQPRAALGNFEHAAALDPLDFRLQSFRCNALDDMARYEEALAACERAHALQPEGGAPADELAWLAWSRGQLDEALRWNAESVKAAPEDFTNYWTRSDWYLTLGLSKPARDSVERGRTTTHDDDGANAALVNVIYVEQGAAGLREHLSRARLDASPHALTLLQAAYARMLIGDASAAKDLIARFLHAPDSNPALDDAPWDARLGNSYEIYLAAAELASGERSAANARLDTLLAMLDRMINSGVQRGATYELRAETQALRGRPEEAMRDLTKAAQLGWRRAWWAEHEPFFASLRPRSDFRALMADVGRSNARLIEKLDLR